MSGTTSWSPATCANKMFTGIVEEVGVVKDVSLTGLRIAAATTLEGAKVGDSTAINGACLTVTSMGEGQFSVDVVPETWRRTNLGKLHPGDPVNLERSLSFGGRMGGHFVQGHVDGTGRIVEISPDGDAVMVRFEADPGVLRYIVEKGFVSIDGISLTVVGCQSDSFSVTLIPFTRANTTFKERVVGDVVNLEVDILAKYIERFLNRDGEGEHDGAGRSW